MRDGRFCKKIKEPYIQGMRKDNNKRKKSADFDPFNLRKCRDVRNDLSKSFMLSLRQQDLQPVHEIAKKYLTHNCELYIKKYIQLRLQKYEKVLSSVGHEFTNNEIYTKAIHLWNEELFFEFHEYLEGRWFRENGLQKEILQAMIRAAGTYIHLEHGNQKGAKTMAQKSVECLEKYRNCVELSFDTDLLITKLRRLDPVPPKLISTGKSEPQ